MRICNATSGTTTAGNVGIGLTNPSEKLQVDGKIKCEDIKYPITDAGGTESDQSLVSLHSTVSSLSTSLSSYALSSALSDYVLSSQFPQADDVTLGGVKIDGNNLSINPSTGILSAVVPKKQSVVHVGVFTLQAATDLRTAEDTYIRWTPALSSAASSSQGLQGRFEINDGQTVTGFPDI